MTVYHSTSVQAAAALERRRLRVHHADPRGGLCAACRRPPPCPDARSAVDFLMERRLPLAVDGQRSGYLRSLLRYAWGRQREPRPRRAA